MEINTDEISRLLRAASKQGFERSVSILSIRYKALKDYCDQHNFLCDETITTKSSKGYGIGETHEITPRSLSYNSNYGAGYIHLRIFLSPVKRYQQSKYGDCTQIYIPTTPAAIQKTKAIIRKRKLLQIQSRNENISNLR